MPRHGGSYERSRKQRKRRGKNAESYHALKESGVVVAQSRTRKHRKGRENGSLSSTKRSKQ